MNGGEGSDGEARSGLAGPAGVPITHIERVHGGVTAALPGGATVGSPHMRS